MPLADAMPLLRGEKGTVVRLDVLPSGNGPSKIIELVRDEVRLPEPTAEQRQQQIANQLRYFQSPMQRLRLEADVIATNGSTWNGLGSWQPIRYLLIVGADAELGLVNDQRQQLQFLQRGSSLSAEWYQQMQQNPTPEYTQTVEDIRATLIPDDPFFEHATEEQKDAYRDAYIAQLNLYMTDTQTKIQEVLSPEQMLQVRELEMQLMPVLGIPFPSMFDPLDLTEEQKKEMQEIADELKIEFDRLTAEAATLKAERVSSAFELLKGKSFSSLEELYEARNNAPSQFVPSEEMRRRNADLHERGRRLLATLQARLMDVLTDEQLIKMQEILDATPEFAKRMIATTKALLETEEKSPVYVPGPNSWRPGDPLPIQFREERQRSRFPRGETN